MVFMNAFPEWPLQVWSHEPGGINLWETTTWKIKTLRLQVVFRTGDVGAQLLNKYATSFIVANNSRTLP